MSKVLPAVLLGACRKANQLAQIKRREPYAIERYPAIQGGVLLIGYDGRGEVMIELRVPATRYSDTMVDRMRRWMKRNDEPPTPMALIP